MEVYDPIKRINTPKRIGYQIRHKQNTLGFGWCFWRDGIFTGKAYNFFNDKKGAGFAKVIFSGESVAPDILLSVCVC